MLENELEAWLVLVDEEKDLVLVVLGWAHDEGLD